MNKGIVIGTVLLTLVIGLVIGEVLWAKPTTRVISDVISVRNKPFITEDGKRFNQYFASYYAEDGRVLTIAVPNPKIGSIVHMYKRTPIFGVEFAEVSFY